MSAARSYQVTIDCADPERMARFWAEALGYVLEGPPEPFASWRDYWISRGVPEDEAGDGGFDSIVDPGGVRPRVWFQQVPEPKAVKNRFHFDLFVGGRGEPIDERRRRVLAESERLTGLGAVHRNTVDSPETGQFAIGMLDPENNEFDIV